MAKREMTIPAIWIPVGISANMTADMTVGISTPILLNVAVRGAPFFFML